MALLIAACGSDEATSSAAQPDAPTVVVTTNILGDVVSELVGDQIEVITIMPVGADPHDFQASAQQVASIENADLVIANGEDFEENLIDILEAAEADGVPVYQAMSTVDALEFGEDGHDDHDDHDDEHGDEDHDDHDDEEHSDEEDAHDGDDPHFFTDPARMMTAAEGIVAFLSANLDVDAEALEANAADYISELEALDSDVESVLADIPDESRVMVTNHEVFAYFADRYGFEVLGSIIPSGTILAGTDAQDLAELAEEISEKGVPAVFADTSSSDDLANALATEAGGITVVQLFTESLGDADSGGGTYLEMVRTNADRIAEALGG